MSGSPEKSLHTLLQEHRFRCRLQRARMIRGFPPSAAGQREAHRMLCEIAMRRVFDQFTPEQEDAIFQISNLSPAPPTGAYRFGAKRNCF